MALEMRLELEGVPPDWEAVQEALKRTGVGQLDYFDNHDFRLQGGFVAYFEKSYAQITKSKYEGWEGDDRTWHNGPRPYVSAEGRHGCKFTVSEGMTFRLNNSRYDEAVEDIRTFLTHLAKLSPMQFVLSFQQEDVYAINCHGQGFQFFWHEPHDANWQPPRVPEAERQVPVSLVRKLRNVIASWKKSL